MNVSPGSYIRIELGVTGSAVDAQPAIRNIVEQAPGCRIRTRCRNGGLRVTILLPQMPVEELPDREAPGGAEGVSVDQHSVKLCQLCMCLNIQVITHD
jgi:hypothetical protein